MIYRIESAGLSRTVLSVLVYGCLLVACSTDIGDGAIEPFTSDRCSYYTEGTLSQQNLWCHCCIEHDVYYWMGGSKQQRVDADRRFKDCIAATGAEKSAGLMWIGVRMFGGPWNISDYRWGFGWPYYRPYRELEVPQQKVLASQLNQLTQLTDEYCPVVNQQR